MSSILRVARPEDAADMLNIYGPYIRDTSITFETEVPSCQAFQERVQSYLQSFPWLVYEIEDHIAGYAYGARHRERTAYQWCVETSIYIQDRYMGSGIARTLYFTLFELLKIQKFRNAYAVINLPNERSVRFHESCGFRWFATYENVGFKLGRWKNVGWWLLKLNDYDDNPEAPNLFQDLDATIIEGVLSRMSASSGASGRLLL